MAFGSGCRQPNAYSAWVSFGGGAVYCVCHGVGRVLYGVYYGDMDVSVYENAQAWFVEQSASLAFITCELRMPGIYELDNFVSYIRTIRNSHVLCPALAPSMIY